MHLLVIKAIRSAQFSPVVPVCRNEYRQFVDGMSYADDADKIRFEDALDTFEALIVLFE